MRGYTISLKDITLSNENFRKVLYTANHSQLVIMHLKPGEDIGEETHLSNDQFFYIESGEATCTIEGQTLHLKRGDAFFVPTGCKHNLENASKLNPLKIFTLYAPAVHQDGTIRRTKHDALVDSPQFEGTLSN